MKKLAQHYAGMKRRRPNDVLIVMFDIDGTILDMRYLIHRVLREYDRTNGPSFFETLEKSDVTVHENHVDELLDQLNVSPEQQRRVLEFWHETRWLTRSLMEAHSPFAGVMEIIRWLQMQPRLVVGLNTGRPESLRGDTLRSLNTLGKEFNVHFEDRYLHMNDGDWEEGVPSSKVAGVRRFKDEGYRVFAMVDNEPANLAAVSELDGCEEILRLHAHTIFESGSEELPICSACGNEYVLEDLASEESLPQGMQFVWHGVNDRANLRQLLASDVQWGEFDVRADPGTGKLVLHHDSLRPTSVLDTEPLLELEEVMGKLDRFEKSFKFDLKEGGTTVDCVLRLLRGESVEET
jgi:phosphoglycolate phosphatase-like HAD superfamily hydrolase